MATCTGSESKLWGKNQKMLPLENKEISGLIFFFFFCIYLNPKSQTSELKGEGNSADVMTSLCLGECQNMQIREAFADQHESKCKINALAKTGWTVLPQKGGTCIGAGGHASLSSMHNVIQEKVSVCACSVAQLGFSLTLCDPVGCSLPGSSVHGIMLARILQWVVFSMPGHVSDSGIEPTSPMAPAGEKPGRFFTTAPLWKPR